MTGRIDVALRKEDVETGTLGGRVAVVLDVLMATTTIVYALAHGMPRVLPVAGARAARAALGQAPEEDFLLAGEWLGRKIPRFASMDPRRWPWPAAREKSLILTSTNGTVALGRAWGAGELYAAALLNAAAVAGQIASLHAGQEILLICAGSDGRFALDDFLAAGCLVERLMGLAEWRLTDSARAALDAFRPHSGQIAEGLSLSRTGRWMVREGWGDLVALAAEVDRFPVVPRREDGWLVRATSVPAP